MSKGTLTPAERRKALKAKRNAVIALLLVVCAGIGWYEWNKAHQVDPTSKLSLAKVTRGDLLETVAATGSVTAQTGAEVHIGSQITGTIKSLKADIGTKVKAGDIIAILDLPDLEAQVRQAKSALDAAETKLVQTQTGVNLEITQTREGIESAEAGVKSAKARLDEAQAMAKLSAVQTPSDIKRADAALATANAALSTARSALKQVQASGNLQIATAQETVTQDSATYDNAAINLKRNQDLLAKGYVAGSIVDNAQEAATVAQAQLAAAKQNVDLVKASVEANLQAAQDTVAQSTQNVQSMVAALDAANAEPYNDKVKQEAVNDARQALDQANSALANAEANKIADKLKQQDVEQAQEAVAVSRAAYQYNLAQMAKSVIRTPIAGTVLNLAVQQGETLAAGLSSPTVIVVADLNRLQVDAYVDETDIGKVKIGQDAAVVVDSFSKHTFKGKVVKIAAGSTIQQGVVTYDVTIAISPKEFTDKRHRLIPDMTANVIITTGKLTDVLLVPSVAIKVSTKGSTVTTLTRKDGKPVTTSVKVSTGGSDDSNTEVRKGLNEGDTVVLAGLESGTGGRFGPQSPFGPKSSGGAKSGGGGK